MVKPEGLSGNGSTDQGTGSKDDFEGEGRRGGGGCHQCDRIAMR